MKAKQPPAGIILSEMSSGGRLFPFFSVESNWKTNRENAIKSWSSKTQLFQPAKKQSILSCSSWFETNAYLWEGTEPYSRSHISGGSQGCSCRCSAPGSAQIDMGQTPQALHTGKQGCLDKLVPPPDKSHSRHCSHMEAVAGFGLKHVFWKPSRPPNAEHCWREAHVSGISPLVQKAPLVPGNPWMPNDPQATREGSLLFPVL